MAEARLECADKLRKWSQCSEIVLSKRFLLQQSREMSPIARGEEELKGCVCCKLRDYICIYAPGELLDDSSGT